MDQHQMENKLDLESACILANTRASSDRTASESGLNFSVRVSIDRTQVDVATHRIDGGSCVVLGNLVGLVALMVHTSV